MKKARSVYLCLGVVFLGLGIVGVPLPGLPTAPFLVLAAWAFARSSKRLHDWLTTHPRFGPPIQRWQDHGVISLPAKIFAIVGMAVSIGAAIWMEAPPALLIFIAAVMLGGAVFILRCPSQPRSGSAGRDADQLM